jgi:hypothetical protein
MTNGKSGTIIATNADVDAGFALYKEIEESNELGLSPYIYSIYNEAIKSNLSETVGLSRKQIRSNYFSVFHKSLNSKLEDSIIQQLEAASLVVQEPDPDDKRRMLVYPRVSENISPDTLSTSKAEEEEEGKNKVLNVSGDISPKLLEEIASNLSATKGYFILREWQTELMFRPVQDPCHMDENQAEHTFYQLLQEGKIEQFEPGKYKPTTTEKLSVGGG